MTLTTEDVTCHYVYDGVIEFNAGKWDFSTSKSFESPFIRYNQSYDGIVRPFTLPANGTFTAGVRPWKSTVELIEAATAPSVTFDLDAPKIFVDSPGAYGACTLVFGSANFISALSPDDWILEFDFRPWFEKDSVKTIAIEDEAIGSEGHNIVKHFTGKLARKFDQAKVQCTINVKDAYIATGFTVSISFLMSAVVRAVQFRPRL